MISMSGEWLGHYIYGPEYGDKLAGKKVAFKFILEDLDDNQFKGSCVDINSFISQQEQAITINGFLEDNFINFTKEYTTYYSIDAEGNATPGKRLPPPELSYSGYYDPQTGIFTGDWELVVEEYQTAIGDMLAIYTGTWEMKRS